MYVRCKSCHGSAWLQKDGGDGGALSATCKRCGQEYEVVAPDGSRVDAEGFHRDALWISREQGIDLPGAHSVLLGIMTLDDVKAVAEVGPPVDEEPVAAPSPQGGRAIRYDPAFDDAVADGCLTPGQARQRGKRNLYASSLAKRHDLPLELALAVSDNRVSLLEATRRCAKKQDRVSVRLETITPKRSAPTWRIAALLVLGAVAIGLAAWPAVGGRILGGSRAERVGRAEVVRDARGRILSIAGPHARSVLAAYCEVASGEGRLEAVDLMPAARRSVRLGLFRDTADRQTLLLIEIHEDPDRRRWIAGDGRAPLHAREAPAGAAESLASGLPG